MKNLYKQQVKTKTPLLDQLDNLDALRQFSPKELQNLAIELRQETIENASKTGGHLGAGLGVTELTIALHHVFNTPDDKIIWDVGHQAYPHKILTGRRNRMGTIRQKDGLSGFTKRSESVFDSFGAGHSSTSISAGLGMKTAFVKQGKNNQVIAVIGDGAMSAGMAFEAMNNAASVNHKMIVILNDNEMSIAPPVGAVSKHLSGLLSSKPYRKFRDVMDKRLPKKLHDIAKAAEEHTRTLLTGGSLFEALDFYYVGPIDGHDLDTLIPVLENIRDSDSPKPVLIHAVTQKGKGYAPAEASADKFHGVSAFDISTGNQNKKSGGTPSYTKVFADTLIQLAGTDKNIVAITAAMPDGTGLKQFAERFPNRCYDVGIAEQHAVTFAAGMATEGLKPFCAIYSTFLQRAFDQVVHDVAIQKLPVRFMIDRAGLVGADGATHAGSFDLAYLGILPYFIIMAPSDEAELAQMVATAVAINDAPSAVRYPRGNGIGIQLPSNPEPLPIGKGRIIQKGEKVALLSLGTCLQACIEAAEGMNITIADARFMKPLDTALIKELVEQHDTLITIEEGSIGGFGSHVLQYLTDNDLLTNKRFRSLTLPDRFLDHGTQEEQLIEAGLGVKSIKELILFFLT